jgi:hypothetical protein
MLELLPMGEHRITRIDKYGLWFRHESSEICIPHHQLIAINSCISCKYFNFKNKEANTCKAFPERIPDNIFLGKNDHKKSYPGDHGIIYKKRE